MHRTYFVSVMAFCGLFGLSGIHHANARVSPTGYQTQNKIKHGVAVWYGEDRQGKIMANGRTFDQWAMTGASVHFPLGTPPPDYRRSDPQEGNRDSHRLHRP